MLSSIPEGCRPLSRARVDGAAGPLALGAKGSACDRLTPYRRAPGFRPRELYSIAALARYGAFGGGKTVQPPCGRRKTGQPRFARVKAFPFGGWRHHLSPLFEGAQQPVLTVEMLMKRMVRGVLFCPRLRGKSGGAGKGEASAASQSAE